MITMKAITSFNGAKVQRAVDRARRQSLSRGGAIIRQTAKHSIRKRKAVSAPGSPPSSHEGTLRRLMRFGYDRSAGSVVVGPMATNQVFFDRQRQPVRGTVPSVLEYGGQITILEIFKFGRWQRADLRSRRRLAGLKTRYRRARIRPRPFIVPALRKEQSKLPKLWAIRVIA